MIHGNGIISLLPTEWTDVSESCSRKLVGCKKIFSFLSEGFMPRFISPGSTLLFVISMTTRRATELEILREKFSAVLDVYRVTTSRMVTFVNGH